LFQTGHDEAVEFFNLQLLSEGGLSARADHFFLLFSLNSRSNSRSFGLRDRIPLFFLPLKPEDPVLAVDLQPLFHEVYDQGNFDLRVDYDQPVPEPALSDDDQVWVQQITTALGA
jgi:hypothetical protein